MKPKFLILAMLAYTSLILIGVGFVTSRDDISKKASVEDSAPEWEIELDNKGIIEVAVKEVIVPVDISEKTTIPKWEQPGTREYLVKMQLDEFIWHYKRYDCKK